MQELGVDLERPSLYSQDRVTIVSFHANKICIVM